jgi:phosphatidylglycerol:prolipoprotein diacylglycerol transferase
MAIVIFAILWRLRTRLTRPGLLFATYLGLAGVERFIVEIFRAKDDRFLGPLTVAQSISIALIVVAVIAASWLRRNEPRVEPASGR